MRRVVESRVYMDTVITIEMRGMRERAGRLAESAFRWFAEVERRCNRFDEESELSRLCASPQTPTNLSPLLRHSLVLAVRMAQETRGGFDPSLGGQLHSLGFNLDYRTGKRAVAKPTARDASYRDIRFNRDGSVTLMRPLLLDLGGIAKGIALDLAALELETVPWFAINAGGDVKSGGADDGERCRVAIRNPFEPEKFLSTVDAHKLSVCTSGDYERSSGANNHVLSRERCSARELRSATVIAAQAAIADAMATAAFSLGPEEGVRLLESSGVHGLLVTPSGEVIRTRRFADFEV